MPADLAERLLPAGFEADDLEQVLALPVDDRTLVAFGATQAARSDGPATRLGSLTALRSPAGSRLHSGAFAAVREAFGDVDRR